MSNKTAEETAAKRAELETLYDRVFDLTILSGRDASWAEFKAEEAVKFESGSSTHRNFTIDRCLRDAGYPVGDRQV